METWTCTWCLYGGVGQAQYGTRFCILTQTDARLIPGWPDEGAATARWGGKQKRIQFRQTSPPPCLILPLPLIVPHTPKGCLPPPNTCVSAHLSDLATSSTSHCSAVNGPRLSSDLSFVCVCVYMFLLLSRSASAPLNFDYIPHACRTIVSHLLCSAESYLKDGTVSACACGIGACCIQGDG